jgi:diaminohydroxyphosphoribosylaminopyrimidine deaminase/5-amino-6-(5-phosphoribosylamino)uracil reductase
MDFMARALHLASRALGTCSPNPAVGAVLVRDGVVVGEGATQPPGQAHAEVVALRAAGAQAKGATLYVTLEPCSHFGRTAPCADAVIAAGVADVHVATLDPGPWVNGRGVSALEQAGIRVRLGAHGAEAQRLNAAYFTWVKHGRPLVTVVYAIGLDGRPRTLSEATLGAAASSELERLRFRADRTLADRTGETVGDLLAEDPTLVHLATSGIIALNVEATPAEALTLAQRGLLDQVMVFVVPDLFDGVSGNSSLGASPAGPLDALPTLQHVTHERLGETLLITGDLSTPDEPATA